MCFPFSSLRKFIMKETGFSSSLLRSGMEQITYRPSQFDWQLANDMQKDASVKLRIPSPPYNRADEGSEFYSHLSHDATVKFSIQYMSKPQEKRYFSSESIPMFK